MTAVLFWLLHNWIVHVMYWSPNSIHYTSTIRKVKQKKDVNINLLTLVDRTEPCIHSITSLCSLFFLFQNRICPRGKKNKGQEVNLFWPCLMTILSISSFCSLHTPLSQAPLCWKDRERAKEEEKLTSFCFFLLRSFAPWTRHQSLVGFVTRLDRRRPIC